MSRRRHTPTATYRIQFSKDFRFVDAYGLVPYLHALGVSHLYASPRFKARRGSSHGYDIADPSRINSELGTEEDFDDLCERLRQYGMGILLDIVPNHMAASHENPWWMDVLEHGPASAYAHYFDIDWHPATTKAAFLQENRVLLPVLGDLYGVILENQEFSLGLDEAGFFVRYYERRFPLDPATYEPILERCLERVSQTIGEPSPAASDIRQAMARVKRIPPRTAAPEEHDRRRALAAEVKRTVFSLYREDPEARRSIDAALWDFAGTRGDSTSFHALDELLNGQPYRLACWKIAFEEINYRRFFDVNDLVRLRVEDDEVYEARHRGTLALLAEGKVDGLRVDHVDGLHDPRSYLEKLHSSAWDAGTNGSLYVVVEKILGRDEELPGSWSCCGTTGYDFLNAINDVLLDPAGLEQVEDAYRRFTGLATPFAEVCYERNRQVMWKMFSGDVLSLGHELGRLAAHDRQARDVAVSELTSALVEVTACLPIYRTYITAQGAGERDRRYLERTLRVARERTSEVRISSAAFGFLRQVLLIDPPAYAPGERDRYLTFVMRWQQFTSPVMAKGLEDTASYVHNALISRNDVGSDPLRETPPRDLESLHEFARERQCRWPRTMNATSTHDTKRSEDIRARIDVLSEIAGEWEERLWRWSRWNDAHKTARPYGRVPTPNEETLIYQTMLGAWPLDPGEMEGFAARFSDFLIKAAREAKDHTGWIQHDLDHERALLDFAGAVLGDRESQFYADFLDFQKRIAWHGAMNSLTQTLVKIVFPGVPDLYQGAETWSFSLVDPDNRRPVDFGSLVRRLEAIRKQESEDLAALIEGLTAEWPSGDIKMYLIDKVLDFRREHSARFECAEYVPLDVRGTAAENVIAFARRTPQWMCVAIAPRWTTRLASGGPLLIPERAWGDTSVAWPEGAGGEWRNILTNERVEFGDSAIDAGKTLRRFPVALLVSE